MEPSGTINYQLIRLTTVYGNVIHTYIYTMLLLLNKYINIFTLFTCKVDNYLYMNSRVNTAPGLENKIGLVHPQINQFLYIMSVYLVLNKNNLLDHNKYIFLYLKVILLSIILGSYWAEQELLWGGFWNWDVIEFSLILLPIMYIYITHLNTTFFLKKIFTIYTLLMYKFLNTTPFINTIHTFTNTPSYNINIILLIYVYIQICINFNIYSSAVYTLFIVTITTLLLYINILANYSVQNLFKLLKIFITSLLLYNLSNFFKNTHIRRFIYTRFTYYRSIHALLLFIPLKYSYYFFTKGNSPTPPHTVIYKDTYIYECNLLDNSWLLKINNTFLKKILNSITCYNNKNTFSSYIYITCSMFKFINKYVYKKGYMFRRRRKFLFLKNKKRHLIKKVNFIRRGFTLKKKNYLNERHFIHRKIRIWIKSRRYLMKYRVNLLTEFRDKKVTHNHPINNLTTKPSNYRIGFESISFLKKTLPIINLNIGISKEINTSNKFTLLSKYIKTLFFKKTNVLKNVISTLIILKTTVYLEAFMNNFFNFESFRKHRRIFYTIANIKKLNMYYIKRMYNFNGIYFIFKGKFGGSGGFKKKKLKIKIGNYSSNLRGGGYLKKDIPFKTPHGTVSITLVMN